jgi:hypothetical protein
MITDKRRTHAKDIERGKRKSNPPPSDFFRYQTEVWDALETKIAFESTSV